MHVKRDQYLIYLTIVKLNQRIEFNFVRLSLKTKCWMCLCQENNKTLIVQHVTILSLIFVLGITSLLSKVLLKCQLEI